MRKGLSIFAAALAGALMFAACEEKIRPSVLSDPSMDSLPDAESWNSTIILSDSGQTTAVVKSAYMQSYSRPRSTLMKNGVVAHLYNEEGQETSVITSNETKVDEETNNLEAIGNVVVVSSEGTVLKTERLFWDNARALIHTNEFVRITSPKERLQGHGLESDQYLRNYRIFRVTGQAETQ